MPSLERELKGFLRERYGIVARTEGGGKHARLVFSYNGQEHFRLLSRSSHSPDPHAIHNDKAEIIRSLGPPPIAEKSPTRTLDQMTEQAEMKAATTLAARTLAPIRSYNEEEARKREQHTVDGPSFLPVLDFCLASDFAVEKDESDLGYDVIFRSRHKVVDQDGKIKAVMEPVAAVSLPLDTILALYDRLQPIVAEARPQPEPVAEAQPEPALPPPPAPEPPPVRKRTPTPAELVPTGIDAILRWAEQLMTKRQQVIAETGATQGGKYNKAMSAWFTESGFGKIPQHIRADIATIGQSLDAIREWAENEPGIVMRTIKPADLVRRWQASKSRPQRFSPEPELRKINGAEHHAAA